tara:strand:- start:463 stop:1587 length:1125 start_codon:yes stop_codon:yes gene_type:complete
MRKLIYLLALWAPITSAQCDVAISSWDAATGDIVIEAINSENCGCNEFTSEDTTCDDSSNPFITNNEVVNHIVLGLHSPGLDYNWSDCTTANNHPGWTFKVATLYGNQVLESGDTWSANVYDFYGVVNDCWSEMLANDTLCMELVIWQINLSQTATTDNGGWAVNPNLGNQTQNYPDVNLNTNSVITCALPACDTIYENVYTTDTIIEYLLQLVYITDTIELIEYIEVIDTIWLTEYIYETDTFEVILLEYITEYVNDTITEFHTITEYIDCDTGEPCNNGFNPCDETSIYAPNVVTPNGDGWNDTWQIIADGCWEEWEVRIYNRWGGLVWISISPTDEWDASVATGLYVYTIKASKNNPLEFYNFNGTVTVLY